MKPPDSHQWDGVTEDSLFLNDGLLRVADLISIPVEICTLNSETSVNWDIETSSEMNSAQLAKQIERMYCFKSSSYQRFQDYRLNALKGLWESMKSIDECEPVASSSSLATKTKTKQNLPFTSRVSLLLIFPLLQSQSTANPELCKTTANLLLECLQDCEPLSLANEPQDCLNGLENLLCSWIGQKSFSVKEQNTLASTLVTLACARYCMQLFF